MGLGTSTESERPEAKGVTSFPSFARKTWSRRKPSEPFPSQEEGIRYLACVRGCAPLLQAARITRESREVHGEAWQSCDLILTADLGPFLSREELGFWCNNRLEDRISSRKRFENFLKTGFPDHARRGSFRLLQHPLISHKNEVFSDPCRQSEQKRIRGRGNNR